MKNKPETVPNPESVKRKDDKHPSRIKKPPSIGWWLIGLLVLLGAALLAGAAVKYRTLEAFPPWVSFLSENLLNLLLLAVVIAQAYIYHKQREAMLEQRDAMNQQLSAMQRQVEIMGIAVEPRLRIANVRAADFGVGGLPVFIVTLVNEGATEARDVEIMLELAEGDAPSVFWTHQQSVTIPANGREEYPIRGASVLRRVDIDGFNSNVLLRVRGHFKHQNTTVKFCYKYYPWPFERRPDGLPQFIPCEFDPGLTINAKAEVRGFSTVTAKATVVRGNTATENEDADNKPGNAPTDV